MSPVQRSRPHSTDACPEAGTGAAFDRASRRRLRIVAWAFVAGFAIIAARLVDLALLASPGAEAKAAAHGTSQARPDIVDRNGSILATDIKVASMYGDPRRIVDLGDTIDQLLLAMPQLERPFLLERLSRERDFVWLKRGVTPADRARIHNLGLPGIGFVDERRRVYPAGRALAHVVGHVNVDNQGQAGIEKYLDGRGDDGGFATPAAAGPSEVALAVDLRVSHAVRDELVKAMDTFSAKAAAAVVLDVATGEVVGLSSLPDYDPHDPKQSLAPDRINRISKGVFELGSTFKAFTVAMALDEGVAGLETSYDARTPIRVGRYSIGDYHAKSRYLTVSEIFVYSSNIGAAKMALDTGVEAHQAFLRRIGMLERVRTELPETSDPLVPDPWRPISTMTIAFGHGLGVTPLHAASAAAALVNGGKLIAPTFLRRSRGEAELYARQVLSADTSAKMRYLMRLNVQKGTARKAAVPGYRVGGKTGTAEKAGPHGYDRSKLLNTFIAAFPIDAPRYIVLVLLDEPRATRETHGFATSGWNAAPTVADIIGRIAPMLGIAPDGRVDEFDAGFLLAAIR
jgi:cell division protein FtsI (penicillin-binding protein 3)